MLFQLRKKQIKRFHICSYIRGFFKCARLLELHNSESVAELDATSCLLTNNSELHETILDKIKAKISVAAAVFVTSQQIKAK